jgi:hypothetical protein
MDACNSADTTGTNDTPATEVGRTKAAFSEGIVLQQS